MARQGIFTGFSPNDGLGDSLALGAIKVNANFQEIYDTFGDGTNLSANAGAGGTWTKADPGIVTSKYVGIGTTTPTSQLHVEGNSLLVGITSGTFVGDGSGLTGVTAVGQGFVVKDDNTLIGVAQTVNFGFGLKVGTVFGGNVTINAEDYVGYSAISGIATYTGVAGLASVATYANLAGIASYSDTCGVATFATTAGIVTYSGASGVATESGFSQYSFLAGVSTYAGVAGIASVVGYAETAGIATAARDFFGQPNIQVSGINASGVSTIAGQGSKIRFDFDATGDLPTSTSWRGMFAYANNTKSAYVSFGTTDGGVNGWRRILAEDVYGNYQTPGILTATKFAGDGSLLTNLPGADSVWRINSTGIHTMGKVGIGTTTCNEALNVVGNIDLQGRIVAAATTNIVPFLWPTRSGFPSATDYHGAFLHAHDVGRAFYAHAGLWHEFVQRNEDRTIGLASDNYRIGICTALEFHGDGSNLTNVTPGIATYTVLAGVATYAETAGVSTSSTYATTAGIATLAQGLTGNPSVNTTGIITAASFVGDGGGLTGITASGSGIIVKDDGSSVGTAGTIDFGPNLSVSAISAGVCTITGAASPAGIDTSNTSYFNKLVVSGFSTFASSVYISGITTIGNHTFNSDNITSKKNLFLGEGGVGGGGVYFPALSGSDSSIEESTNGLDFKMGLSNDKYARISTDGVETRLLKPFIDSTYDIGTNAVRYATAYVDNVSVGNSVTATSFHGDGSNLTGISGGGGGQGYWSKNVSGLSTTSNVGIQTSNPNTQFEIANVYGVQVASGQWTAAAGVGHTVDSWTIATTDFKTAEYTLHIGIGTYIQAQKVLVMQDGTTAWAQEYAIMSNPEFAADVTASIVSGDVKLVVTPATGISGAATYRLTRQSML